MISFKTEFAKAVEVNQCSMYSWGGKPIASPNDINKDAGITRNSYLCYIKFNSLVNPENKVFFLAYKVKPFPSQVRNPALVQPKWYLTFRDNKTGQMELLDKNMANIVFDFDVDKFFDTKFFQTCLEMMKKKVSNGIANAEQYLQGNPKAVPECSNSMRGIKLGLSKLDADPVFNDMGTIREVDPRHRYDGVEFDDKKMSMFWQQRDKFAGQERGPSSSEIRRRQKEQDRQDAAVRKAAAKSNRTLNRLITTISKMD